MAECTTTTSPTYTSTARGRGCSAAARRTSTTCSASSRRATARAPAPQPRPAPPAAAGCRRLTFWARRRADVLGAVARLGDAVGGPLPRLRADPAPEGLRRAARGAQRLRLPAHERRTRSSCSAPTRARRARASPARSDRRARRGRTRSCSCASAAARNASLSIPRDTVVDIPGHGQDKINAAYAIGGPALAIAHGRGSTSASTVNHLVEVNFENFPELIDALGGIDVHRRLRRLAHQRRHASNGGYTLRLRAGTNELDGKQALALARTRKNDCNPREDDRTRARRQQKILAAMKGKVLSPRRSSGCRGCRGPRRRRSAPTWRAPPCSASSGPR